MHDEDNRSGQRQRREQPQPQQEVADLADDVEGQQAPHFHLGNRAQHAGDHRQPGQHQQQGVGVGHVLREEQGERPDQGVHADLGQQRREDRGDRQWRGVVGVRQPEEQREDGGLDPEGDQEEHGQHGDQPRLRGLPQLHGQVGHVERPHHAVQDADRAQEQGGGHQVQRKVLDRAGKLGSLPAQHEQDEGRDQQHLEPHVQVEEVTRQERAADAHQQDEQ